VGVDVMDGVVVETGNSRYVAVPVRANQHLLCRHRKAVTYPAN
jgi:hypothetical protein